jgi:L-alanine-DL-glutamate epimerase-like enolase superfamily enzyme
VIVPEVTVAADGTVEVPRGPGLGFEVDFAYIERYTETAERIEGKR